MDSKLAAKVRALIADAGLIWGTGVLPWGERRCSGGVSGVVDTRDEDGREDAQTIGGAALLDRMVRQRDERIAALTREIADLRQTVDAQAARIRSLSELSRGR